MHAHIVTAIIWENRKERHSFMLGYRAIISESATENSAE